MNELPPTPTERLLKFFEFAHLPPFLQDASEPFCSLAHTIANGPTSGPETTVALRKLLEAKDCYVRAFLAERAKVSGVFAGPAE